MSFFGNIFPAGNQPKNEKSPFEGWVDPPKVSEIPAGRVAITSLPAGNQSMSAALGPSIVIGLGATGHAVLNQWLEQMTHYESGAFVHVRILSLSVENRQPLPDVAAQTHQIVFGNSVKGGHCLDAFLEAAVLRKFYDWLRIALLAMRDAQVLIVGSLEDPEIHLLGVVLQILRSFPDSKPHSFLNIIALLSLSSVKKNQGISTGERYAALREAGRFTFSGLHKTFNLPVSNDSTFQSALLDHLFLFDESAFDAATEFNKGLGQALSETLFFLNHPASKPFWETLKTDNGGELRRRHHQPFAQTMGIKTFFIPIAEIQSYLALRLSYAVLFGERRAQDAADQFVSQQKSSRIDPSYVEATARRWLVDGGVGYHPVFQWLWTFHPSNQSALPEIHTGYHDLYSFKVSHSLVKFLNEPSPDNRLEIAELAIHLHVQHFEKLLTVLSTLASAQPFLLEELKDMLRVWKKAAEGLQDALGQWRKSFLVDPSTPPANQEKLSNSSLSQISLNWKTAQQASDNTTAGTIQSMIQRRLRTAEKTLLSVTGDKVRFTLTYDANAPLGEVENYYADSIRPELSHLGLPVGAAFRAVRNRLEWWIRLIPSRAPELLVVCWHGNATATSGQPNPEYCYSYNDKQKLVDAIVNFAATQSGGYDDLTGEWYTRSLRRSAAVVHGKTEEVFLRYDENISSKLTGDRRNYYLVGKDKVITGNFLKDMFPLRLPSDVKELDGYDPTRFTVMASRFSIPISALHDVNQWYDSYNHFSGFHASAQERIAAIYEDRIFREQGTKILFTPDFVLMLFDSQLITLFCQALFCKIIRLQNKGMGNPPAWQVSPLTGFDALDLETPSSPDGLLEAFRKFVLEMPNDPALTLNPSRHFHLNRRPSFLSALLKETRAMRGGDKFKALQNEFKNGILAEWQKRNDPFSASFAALLQIELIEPVWEGWYL